MIISPDQEAQIALFMAKKVAISTEYLDFTNVFSQKFTAKLLEQLNLNQYAIILEPGKKLLYRLFYSLKPVELGTFKIYIETNLVNSFIRPSKFSIRALILFVQKQMTAFTYILIIKASII